MSFRQHSQHSQYSQYSQYSRHSQHPHRPRAKVKPPKDELSLGVRAAGFYFFLVFAIWPLTVNIFPAGSLPSRFPLLVGVIMFAVALKEGRNLGQILKPAQLFFTFCLFSVLSSLHGPLPPGLIEGIISLVRNVGIGVALVLTIRSIADLNFFLRVFIWYGVASTLYGLMFMVPGLTTIGAIMVSMGLPTGKDINAMRMNGLQTDPTYLGLSIMPAFLINLNEVLSTQKSHKKGKRSWLAFVITVLILLGIILSFSRTTWVATAAGVLMLTGLQGNMFRSAFYFFVIVVFLQVAAPNDVLEVAMSQNADRATFEVNQRNDSRSGIWKAYFRLATEEPWGYGMGSIEHLRNLPSTFTGLWAAENPRPHNMYLFIWVEAGVQALLPLLFLLALSFVRSWKIRNYVDPKTGSTYGALAMSLLTSMSLGLFGLGGLLQLLSIMIAIGLVVWYLKMEKQLIHMEQLKRGG